jgi:hypothetical protein
MANSPNDDTNRWLQSMARNVKPIAMGLLIAAGAAAAVTIILLVRYQPSSLVIVVGTIWLSVATAGVGLWALLREPGSSEDADVGRTLIVSLGGGIGLGVYLLAFLMIYAWWDTVGGGLEEWQGEKGWRIWVIALTLVTGLGLTFASLLIGRTEQQSNPVLRRLLYGYNAVLAGQLLLLILLVINILGYIYLPQETDWTRSRLYTLADVSQNTLKNLEKPLKVYVILDTRDDAIFENVDRLLNNCRAVNPKVQVEVVLRGRQNARVQELMRRYLLTDPHGVLVVSGPETKEDSEFIKWQDLYKWPEFDPMQRRRTREEPTFRGEEALMSAIKYLEEGKSRPTVYFLQGHGELDISRSIEPTRPQHKADQLRSLLEKANHTVKALRLSAAAADKPEEGSEVVSAKVPDDASVVVVAGPRRLLEREAIAALRDYMNPKDAAKKKGKLMVLLDVVVGPDKQMIRTGLEPFMAEFNVDVGNDRILCNIRNNPEIIYATPSTTTSDRNALAAGLGDEVWPMMNVRTVKPKTSGPPQATGANYQPEKFLATTNSLVWSETNLDDPVKIIEDLVRSGSKGLRERLVPQLPVAVTVSESSAMPGDPHAGLLGGESKPRLVVFGNAAWASDSPLPSVFDQRQLASAQSLYYSLFASSLAWLREKPGAIGIEAKARDKYQLPETTKVDRMLILPVGLMFVSILGLGLGVWVVRRR